MKREAEELHKYGTTESMTAHRDHDVPLRGPLTQSNFDRFPANKVFFINRSKNLIFAVRFGYLSFFCRLYLVIIITLLENR